MSTTIRLTAPGLDVTFTGNGVYEGYTYDKLEGWQSLASVDLGLQKRPNAPGSFAPGQTSAGELVISIEGQFFGLSEAAALQAREDLSALYNDGRPLTMTVTDALRATSREVYVAAIDVPWTIHKEFKFALDVTSPDPRRFGANVHVSTGIASAGAGLAWPSQVSPEIGLVWPIDWGTPGTDGRVVVTNPGNAEAVSTYTLSGGSILDGFALVNIETGERLTYIGPMTEGSTITLDTDARTAFINDTVNGGRFMPSPEWWSIPPKSTRTIQLVILGGSTGAPVFSADTRPAYY